MDPDEQIPADVDHLIEEVAARRRDVDDSGVRPTIWTEIADSMLAVVDGGPTPAVTTLADEGERMVIVDQALFGPDPSAGIGPACDALSVKADRTTVLGHMGHR